MYIHMYVYVHIFYVLIYMFMYMYSIHIYVHTNKLIYTYIYVNRYIYICTYIGRLLLHVWLSLKDIYSLVPLLQQLWFFQRKMCVRGRICICVKCRKVLKDIVRRYKCIYIHVCRTLVCYA
jgi:hypothetical protein